MARLARRAIRRRVITCTTPSQDWPHPQPGRVNKGAAKYRTTRQVCSVDKLSFVPRCFPHMRSLSILGSTPDRDRCAAAPLDVSCRFTMGCPRHAYCGHDVHATVAMCITLPLVEPFLPMSFGHRQMHYSSKPAEQPVFPRGARLVTSPMRQDLAETKR